MDFILIAIGIVGLFFGGEVFVKGSVGLSLRYGVPRLLIGMTIIAFGTSLPELLVSLQSALGGYGDIVLGNVVGSNIVNILVILGVPAVAATVPCDGRGTNSSWIQMMIATLLLFALLMFQPLGLWHGLALLAVFAVSYTKQIRDARQGMGDLAEEIDDDAGMLSLQRTLFYVLLGAILLPLGAKAMVTGAVNIASDFGISEAVIGLTIVAIGTSLPELAATISAIRNGENALALGNVIGSNLLNISLVLGFSAVVTPIAVSPQIVKFDMPFLIAISLALGYFTWRGVKIGRVIGAAMLVVYALYVGMLIWMS